MGEADPPYVRAHERSPVAVSVVLTPAPDPSGRAAPPQAAAPIAGTTRNLGLGGFSVELAEPLPVGTHLATEVCLGEGDAAVRIHARGQVVWVRGRDVGVAFTGADAKNRKLLSDRFLCNPMASRWD